MRSSWRGIRTINALANQVCVDRESRLHVTEHTNLEERIRFFAAYRLAQAVQRMRAWFHFKPLAQVRPRYVAVIPPQEDMEDLRELQWRAAVQRNFERRRRLSLLQGGRRDQRGGT
jgi:hypothetical protein